VEIDGKRYSHIVDPRTGMALTSRRSATVIASDGTAADSLTKVASVLEPDRAFPIIESFGGASALVVRQGAHGLATFASKGFPELKRTTANKMSGVPRADAAVKRTVVMLSRKERAMPDFTPYQQKIIQRYYDNQGTIQRQRLAELVSELFLAEGKKRKKAWTAAAAAMQKLGVPQSRIDHLVKQTTRPSSPSLSRSLKASLEIGSPRPAYPNSIPA